MAAEFALLLDLWIIAIFATLLAYFSRLIRQPIIVAYIIAGLIIGPIGLGLITDSVNIAILSELGIAFLLFTIGIETEVSKLLRIGKTIVIGAVLQVALTIFATFEAMQFFGVGFTEATYVALIVAFSSTAVIVKMLSDMKQISTLHGRLLIGFMLMQDVLIILAMPLLANISNIVSASMLLRLAGNGTILLVLTIIANKFVFPALFRYSSKSKSSELLFLTSLSACFAFIGAALLLNFSIAIGAFLAGIALSGLPYTFEVLNSIKGLRDFLVTVFFVSLGMQISAGFAEFNLALIIAVFVLVILLKPALFFLVSLLAGYGYRTSIFVGLATAQISEFSFIIAASGLAAGLISTDMFSLLILVTAVSMALTPYLMKYSESIYLALGRIFRKFRPVIERAFLNRSIAGLENLPGKELNGHIIVVGAGALGSNIASALQNSQKVIVIDHDPEVVFGHISRKFYAIYGNVESSELWEKANLEKAKLLAVTIPDFERALFLVQHARKINRDIAIIARAHYYDEALELYNKGADLVIMPEIISSNVFLQNISKFLESGKRGALTHMQDEYIEFLKEKAAEQKRAFKL